MLFTIALILLCLYMNKYFKNKRQKRILDANKTKTYLNRKSNVSRDRFSNKKIPQNLDAIVIGSGISGLTTAALLSRFGKKVLVLEGHYIAGGCTHTFKDKGFEFDTGLHYVGKLSNKASNILKTITKKEILWDQMGYEDKKYVYDTIILSNRRFTFRPDSVNWLKDMGKYFPKDREALREYLYLVKKVCKMRLWIGTKLIKSKWWSTFLNYWFGGEFFKIAHSTTYDVLKGLTKNEELIAVLCAQFGNYGLTPKHSSFYTHCIVVNHYFEGGFYPRGGPEVIAKNIIPIIEESGGRVLVGKKVKKILIEDRKACGVIMENGIVIKAKNIISSAGVNNTFRKLLTPELDLCMRLNNIGYSDSLIQLFIGLNQSGEKLGLKSENIWELPDRNYDKLSEDFNKDPIKHSTISFIACPSSKDRDWKNRYPNKSTAVVMCPTKWTTFSQWNKNKNDEYKKFKKVLEKKLLNIFFKRYPKARDSVVYTELGTPLTYNTYINSSYGEVYGISNSKKKYKIEDILKPYTHIDNLYLTGQDVLSLGFAGALLSGYLTANVVLGYNIFNFLLKQDCVEDILEVS